MDSKEIQRDPDFVKRPNLDPKVLQYMKSATQGGKVAAQSCRESLKEIFDQNKPIFREEKPEVFMNDAAIYCAHITALWKTCIQTKHGQDCCCCLALVHTRCPLADLIVSHEFQGYRIRYTEVIRLAKNLKDPDVMSVVLRVQNAARNIIEQKFQNSDDIGVIESLSGATSLESLKGDDVCAEPFIRMLDQIIKHPIHEVVNHFDVASEEIEGSNPRVTSKIKFVSNHYEAVRKDGQLTVVAVKDRLSIIDEVEIVQGDIDQFQGYLHEWARGITVKHKVIAENWWVTQYGLHFLESLAAQAKNVDLLTAKSKFFDEEQKTQWMKYWKDATLNLRNVTAYSLNRELWKMRVVPYNQSRTVFADEHEKNRAGLAADFPDKPSGRPSNN